MYIVETHDKKAEEKNDAFCGSSQQVCHVFLIFCSTCLMCVVSSFLLQLALEWLKCRKKAFKSVRVSLRVTSNRILPSRRCSQILG